MPIPRRISLSELEATTPQTSGVYQFSSEFAICQRIQELEEVAEHGTPPAIPSLMPARATVRSPEPHRPAPASITLGSPFEEDDLEIKLDLQVVPSRASQNMAGVDVTTRLGPGPAPVPSIDPLPGIIAFAGYGVPPEGWAGTSAYAMRVIARKWTLRDDLRIAQMRCVDVTLYEAALACADETAVTKGIAVITACVGSLVAGFATAIATLL